MTLPSVSYIVSNNSFTLFSEKSINLPSSPSIGDEVAFVDYYGTFGTNNVTVGRGGSNIQGVASDITLNVDRRSTTFVYTDATRGWVPVNDNTGAEYASNYTQATGGTETTSGDFKIHTFNSSSNFVVTQVGQPGYGTAVASYMVVAGGGGGGSVRGGGGGAGGFREGRAANDSYTVSPLNAPAGLTLTQTQQQIEEEGEAEGLEPSEIARLQAEAAEMWEDFDTTAFRPNVAQGGLMRTNYALGSRPTEQESGLGGLPIEADMRYTGGFMPYGAKEKADDVPARLSKNEFVFTADAVRGAGGGDINTGAKRMYQSMKQLEQMGKRA